MANLEKKIAVSLFVSVFVVGILVILMMTTYDLKKKVTENVVSKRETKSVQENSWPKVEIEVKK